MTLFLFLIAAELANHSATSDIHIIIVNVVSTANFTPCGIESTCKDANMDL